MEGVGAITAEEALALSATGPHPALHRRRLGPAPHHAVPRLRPGRLRRHRRHLRRQLRPLRHPPQRDPRVDTHPVAGARQDAPRRLPGAGQEGHPAAAGPHRRVDGSAHPPLQDLHRGLQGARGRGLRGHRVAPGRARLLHGVRRLGQAVPACTSAAPSFVNLQSLPVMLHGGLVADAIATISSVDPVMGEVDR